MEAKLCSDGSSVGRTGPRCEFAACPGVIPKQDVTAKWKTYTNTTDGFYFKYPENLSANYIRTQSWPPSVTVSKGDFYCNKGGSAITGEGSTTRKTIGSSVYCITEVSEGAAGTVYETFSYKTLYMDRLVTFNFTFGYVQCGNYEQAKMSECEQERKTFDVGGLVNQIFSTFKFNNLQK
jgi:hypothetical protein